MSNKYQIVPALAAAVHGATEEIPLSPNLPSPQIDRRRLASLASSTSSTQNLHGPILSASTQPGTFSHVNVRKAFTYFDKNRDGKLTIKEFKSVMHDLGYKSVDKRFIRQMFAEATRKGNGHTLTYDEFVQFLRSKFSFTTDEDVNLLPSTNAQFDIETLFNCYDLDKNGYIEPKELRKVMKRLTGEKLSKRDIEEMINVADKNGDGLLDKTEFALLCSAF